VSTKNDRPTEPGPSDKSPAPAKASPAAPAKSPASRSGRWLTVGVILGTAAAALTYGVVGAKLSPSAPLVILTFGGGALAFCGLSLYRVLEPLLRPAAAAARAADTRQSTRLRELEREKGLVLKAIREIENDFQMRKISESDYKEMTHRYRTRALRLIREIDAGDDFRGLIEQELKTRLAALAAAPAAPAASDPASAPTGATAASKTS
jgi:hypothetical protein